MILHYNNFIFNYITQNKKVFDTNKIRVGPKTSGTTYDKLTPETRKQLEYLTCRNLNNNYKLYK